MKDKIYIAIITLLLVLGISGMATTANQTTQGTTALQQNPQPDCRYPPCDNPLPPPPPPPPKPSEG